MALVEFVTKPRRRYDKSPACRLKRTLTAKHFFPDGAVGETPRLLRDDAVGRCLRLIVAGDLVAAAVHAGAEDNVTAVVGDIP